MTSMMVKMKSVEVIEEVKEDEQEGSSMKKFEKDRED